MVISKLYIKQLSSIYKRATCARYECQFVGKITLTNTFSATSSSAINIAMITTMFRAIFVALLVAGLFVSYAKAQDDPFEINVKNGGSWGFWGTEERCPFDEQAVGFTLKVQRPLGRFRDDTALNGIGLKCENGSWIYSTQGDWGEWSEVQECPNDGRLVSFQLRVEPAQGIFRDDTAANDVNFRCTAGEILTGDSPAPWGDWGDWSGNCSYGIRGISTKIEPRHDNPSRVDNTALNDVEFACL